MGIDAGLTSPGFSVVETSAEFPVGKVVLSECFVPKWIMAANGKVAKVGKTKQDAYRIGQITRRLLDIVKKHSPDVIIAELPTGGAKSGAAIRGMAFSTAMTVAALEAVAYYDQAGEPKKVVYISPIDNKKGSTGKKTWDVAPEQSKLAVYKSIDAIWPGIAWPMQKRKKTNLDLGPCFAMADSLSCIATYLRGIGALSYDSGNPELWSDLSCSAEGLKRLPAAQ